MGYGGYINPFTNEAQVNAKVPQVRLPSISGHEVGHQIGYASESDTNFIGLTVTALNPEYKNSIRSRSPQTILLSSRFKIKKRGTFSRSLESYPSWGKREL